MRLMCELSALLQNVGQKVKTSHSFPAPPPELLLSEDIQTPGVGFPVSSLTGRQNPIAAESCWERTSGAERLFGGVPFIDS